MSLRTESGRPVLYRGAAWRLDPSSSLFELIIKHRYGPISVAGHVGLGEGLLRVDPAGHISIGFTIDTRGIEMTNQHGDPRLRPSKLPALNGSSLVRFKSSDVTDGGAGRMHVTGQLAVGRDRVPVEFVMRLSQTDGETELAATMTVDHRRLGIMWIPAPFKAPTELVVRARLRHATRLESRKPIVPARTRRPKTFNSRYRFMNR